MPQRLSTSPVKGSPDVRRSRRAGPRVDTHHNGPISAALEARMTGHDIAAQRDFLTTQIDARQICVDRRLEEIHRWRAN